MLKKMLSMLLALITVLSMLSVAVVSASAQETEAVATADEATIDEATVDEAKLVLTDEPNVPAESVNGTIIGYMGDSNLDGKINIKDCTAIQKYLAKYTLLNERAKLLSDADNNQKLNVRDATAIQKYVAGMQVESVVWHLLYETGTHTHNYVEEVVEVKCETDGYTLKSCICGDESKENVIEAKGHAYKIKRVDATCVDEGYTLYDCQNCNYSEKRGVAKPTGKHVFENRTCKYCSLDLSDYSFDKLRDYLIANGEYDKDTQSYVCEIIPDSYGIDDIANVLYCEADQGIAISYAANVEGYVDAISIGIYKGQKDFIYYMICSGVFEGIGTYDMGKYTVHIKDLENIELYYAFEGIDEQLAIDYTLDYIDFALGIYEDHQRDFGVTIKDLGFKNFVYNG